MVSQACLREVAAAVSATDAPPPLSACAANKAVQEPFEVAGRVITPQNLYTGLFVIGELLSPSPPSKLMSGIPMLWIAAPLSTVFWIVGSSACVVGAHAGLMEPGIES